MPGIPLWSAPIAQLFTTKDESDRRNHPQKVFILYFFNRIYQIMIPQNPLDRILLGKETTLPIHPAILDVDYVNMFGKSHTFTVDMKSNEKTVDSKIERRLTFDEMV